jgi:hypothetical protein
MKIFCRALLLLLWPLGAVAATIRIDVGVER